MIPNINPPVLEMYVQEMAVGIQFNLNQGSRELGMDWELETEVVSIHMDVEYLGQVSPVIVLFYQYVNFTSHVSLTTDYALFLAHIHPMFVITTRTIGTSYRGDIYKPSMNRCLRTEIHLIRPILENKIGSVFGSGPIIEEYGMEMH